LKKSASNILKYIYISTNILLALYILANTSFLQTTLYKYVAQQNGFVKIESSKRNARQTDIGFQSSHAYKFKHDHSDKPGDLAQIYFLLAVISSVQLFSPKGSINRKTIEEALGFFKKFNLTYHRLFCAGAIFLRAPPYFFA